MTDLHALFSTLDSIPTHLEWTDVEQRLLAVETTPVDPNRRPMQATAAAPRTRARFGPSRALVVVAVALLLAVVAVGTAVVGSLLERSVPQDIRPSVPQLAPPSVPADRSTVVDPGCPDVSRSDQLQIVEGAISGIETDTPIQFGCTFWAYGGPAGLTRIDVSTGEVAFQHPADQIYDIARDGDDLWLLAGGVTGDPRGALLRVSPMSGDVLQEIPLTSDQQRWWLQIFDGHGWVTDGAHDPSITLFDLSTGTVVGTVHIENLSRTFGVPAVAPGATAAWVLVNGHVERIDATTLEVTTVPASDGATAVAVVDGRIFYGTVDGEIVQVDPITGAPMTSAHVDATSIHNFAVSDTTLWAVLEQPPSAPVDARAGLGFARIDPATGQVIDRLPPRAPQPDDSFPFSEPNGLYTTNGAFWFVPDQPAPSP